MSWKPCVTSVLLIGLLAISGVWSQSDSCSTPADDGDPVELAQMNVMPTEEAVASSGGQITLDIIASNMKTEMDKDAQLKALVAEETDLQKTMVADVEEVQQQLYRPYWYHNTCPSYVHWLYWRRWHFISGGLKCFAFYPVYYTNCGNRYCGLYYKPTHWWHSYYRCMPEYSYRVVWALCYNPKLDKPWVRRPIRVMLQRGCCCKRFWWRRHTALDVCPAATTSTAP